VEVDGLDEEEQDSYDGLHQCDARSKRSFSTLERGHATDYPDTFSSYVPSLIEPLERVEVAELLRSQNFRSIFSPQLG